MKKSIFNVSIIAALLSAGVVQAADVYTLSNGNFDFYQADGVLAADYDPITGLGVNHSNVFADGITADPDTGIMSAPIDFTAGTGRLITTVAFNGVTWVADVAAVTTYDGATGGAQTLTYTVLNKRYADVNDSTITTLCSISGSINNCADEELDPNWVFDRDLADTGYTYTIAEGQFALHLFFDWSGNNDIPVLAVFNIDSIDANGNLITRHVDSGDVSVDGLSITDCIAAGSRNCNLFTNYGPGGDGTPATRMKSAPFPDQTPAFSGSFVPVTNDAPLSANTVLSTDEDVVLNVTLSNFTESATTFPSRAYIAASKALYISAGTNYTTNGTGTITPGADYNGSLTVPVGLTIGVFDGAAFNSTVTVNSVNDAPVFVDGHPTAVSNIGGADSLYDYTPVITDVDGPSASFSIQNMPSWMAFDAPTGRLTGDATGLALGAVYSNIIISVDDGAGAGNSVANLAFNITITGLNNAPILTGDLGTSIDQDAVYSVTLTGSDVDGDALAFNLDAAPNWLTVTGTTATSITIGGTPTNADVATGVVISVTVTDGQASDTISTSTFVVNNVNDAPVLTNNGCVTESIEVGSDYSCSVSVNDIDVGDSVAVTATGLPSFLSLATSGDTTTIAGTAIAGSEGDYNVVVTATDIAGATDTVSFTLTILPFNQPPVATGTLLKTPVDTDLNGSLVDLASDPENCGCLTFRNEALVENTSFGRVTINADGSFTYTPNAGYNGTDSFSYIATDELRDSEPATVQIIVGVVEGETYAGSNFTMFDATGANANGGTNDVIASWDGLYNVDESDTDFSHMTLSSITKYFGNLWNAHHIRVFGPGTYTFDTTCTVTQLENSEDCSTNALQADPAQTERFITFTVEEGQIGAHMLFDWSVNPNIDVVLVWDVNAEFDNSNNPNGVLFNGIGYGPYPWSESPAADTTWRLASSDSNGDGIPGIPMVDGAFIGFNANFNLDIVTTGSNFTMFDATGANANGGTNDVNASWDGLYNTNESDTDFSHMTLSSITKYFGNLWNAHHIRVYGPGTYTFDTTCTVAQIEAGGNAEGSCSDNPLQADPPQIERLITFTVAEGQVGAHMLFDWSVNPNIDVVMVWDINAEFDNSNNPNGVLFNGIGYGPYPWSESPAADSKWRLASSDGNGDGIPGIPMVDGAFIGFNASFNIFAGAGEPCVPTADNALCGIEEPNPVIPDPEINGALGSTNVMELFALLLTWLGFGFTRRRAKS